MRGLRLHLAACALALAAPFLRPHGPVGPDTAGFPGWPATFEGRALAPLGPTDLDRRFLADFVGLVARFSDGEREVVFRWAPRAHRDVHPAAVCFRAAGWEIEPLPLAVDASGAAWGRFRATRGGDVLDVREQVRDARGTTWSDVTSWYWASLLGSTEGPAWVVSVAAPARN